VCDVEVMGAPSISSIIRKAAALARAIFMGALPKEKKIDFPPKFTNLLKVFDPSPPNLRSK
jgi:hypothetical protein